MSDRRADWLGSVHLAQSIPAWLIALVAATLAAGIITYGVVGSYSRKAHVIGLLEPVGGEINVAAPVAGRIAELRVREGQRVTAGQIMVVLDTDKTSLVDNARDGVGNAAALVERELNLRSGTIASQRAALLSQAELRRSAIADRVRGLENELMKLSEEIDLETRRRNLALLNIQRYEDLVKANFMSPAQLQTQQDALLEQEAKLNSLERTRLALQVDRTSAEAEQKQNSAELAGTLAGSDRELLALKQEVTENSARRTTVLTAPRAGVVGAMALGLGQWVRAGQNLASIQPLDAPLQAQLLVPSRDVGFTSPGERVFLRYSAYPYQKFGLQSGHVDSVSESGIAPADLPSQAILPSDQQSSEKLYRVTVSLDSQSIRTYQDVRPLRAGMAVEADIVQERRRIVEWLFEPLFAAARRH